MELLEEPYDPSAFGSHSDGCQTALHEAAESGQAEVVQCLLDSGVDLNPQDSCEVQGTSSMGGRRAM